MSNKTEKRINKNEEKRKGGNWIAHPSKKEHIFLGGSSAAMRVRTGQVVQQIPVLLRQQKHSGKKIWRS